MEPIRVLQVVPAMDCGGMEAFLMNIYRNIDRTHFSCQLEVHPLTNTIRFCRHKITRHHIYTCTKHWRIRHAHG